MARKKEVKAKVEPQVKAPKEAEKFQNFRYHRILHGGKQMCDTLQDYKDNYKLIHWDFEPVGNQNMLIVEIEPK